MSAVAPIVNALNRPFWDGAAAGRLVLPHCLDTGRAFWPPSPISPIGHGPVCWQEVEPEAIVVAIAVYHRAFQAAFADRLPYGVAHVALDCGARLSAHVIDPSLVEAGGRVRLIFRTLFADGAPLLVAVPHIPRPEELP